MVDRERKKARTTRRQPLQSAFEEVSIVAVEEGGRHQGSSKVDGWFMRLVARLAK